MPVTYTEGSGNGVSDGQVVVEKTPDSVEVPQTPQRDAATESEPDSAPDVELGDGSDDKPVSTATYRGKKKK